jgi:CRP-like cAMP-binding protein
MFVTEVLSFYAQEPTREHVEALEDAEIHYLTHADLEALYQDTDGIETFGRRFLEQIMTELKGHLLSQLHDPAPDRYARLLQRRPEFVQRIPLRHIASFLGIAPSTLSRIRARRAARP